MYDNLHESELISSKKYQIIKRLCGVFMDIFSKNLNSDTLGNLMVK